MSAGEEALRREYVVGDEIGRGCFGMVCRCYAAAMGTPFALKSTPKAPMREDPLDLALAEQEPKVHLLASAPLREDPLDLALAEQEPKVHLLVSAPPASSRHVVALHAAFEDADAVHLVLDLCAGGDLLSLLSARGDLSEPEAADLAAQLADALAWCHRRGVAHRDIKSDNILFDAADADAGGGARARLRLADFGSAGWFGMVAP